MKKVVDARYKQLMSEHGKRVKGINDIPKEPSLDVDEPSIIELQ